LEKYTGKNIPDESTLRKNYIRDIYLEKLSSVRGEIQDGPIWVSIDEMTDVEGRCIGNVVIGKLCDEPTDSILLNCEKLEKSNHQTIAKLFNDFMSLLWPSGVKHENVLLFVSDAAPCLVKAGKALNIFYPKLIHLTCLAHGFHRVTETIIAEFPIVDSLIANVKIFF